MSTPQQPKVELVITLAGVEAVRLYGGPTWAEEDATLALFRRLRPLLAQVPLALALDDASSDWRPS